MRTKRAVMPAILVIALTCTYYFYTLHIQTHTSADQSRETAANQGKRLLSTGHNSDAAMSSGDTGEESAMTGFTPSEEDTVNQGENRDLVSLEEDTSGTDDASIDALKRKVEQQQKLFEEQAQMLQKLQKLQESLLDNHIPHADQGSHYQDHGRKDETKSPEDDFTENNIPLQAQRPYDFKNSHSFLDRVEKFNGEIKGKFNGMILRGDNNFGGSGFLLASNGIQPRRRSKSRSKELARLDAQAQENTRGNGVTSLTSDSKHQTINQLPQQADIQGISTRRPQAAWQQVQNQDSSLRDEKRQGEKSTDTNQSAPVLDNLQQQPEQHAYKAVGDSRGQFDLNSLQDENIEVSDPDARAMSAIRDGEDMVDQDADKTGSHGAGQNEPWEGNRYGTYSSPARPSPPKDSGDMEVEIEKVIQEQPGADLLEDRFRQIQDDLDDVKPGNEPEVQQDEWHGDHSDKEKHNGAVHSSFRDSDRTLHSEDDAVHKAYGNEKHQPAHNKDQNKELPADENSDGLGEGQKKEGTNSQEKASRPADGMVASVYDLSSQPTSRHRKCQSLRLSVLSRVICVPADKGDIAAHLMIEKGSNEEAELSEFLTALGTSDSIGAVDLGAGLGVFTVAAASKNHPVLAVEPSMDLAKLIHQTVQANSLVNVTLVTDALGDQVGAGRLSGSNAGDMRVRPVSLSDIGRDVSNLVRIIRLDDLLPLVTFRRAVIKLGNLGEDSKVLKGARRFFAQTDVHYLLMHWQPSKEERQNNYLAAATFLRQYNLEPARTVKGKELYTDAELQTDLATGFVVWRKKGLF